MQGVGWDPGEKSPGFRRGAVVGVWVWVGAEAGLKVEYCVKSIYNIFGGNNAV